MELKFRVFAYIAKPVHEVFEAVADPEQLSHYFATGGAKGRLEEGATVTWDFHDFPGAFPVHVAEVVPDERGGKVVEEAVGDQRVVARVPERVPDEDAVANELGAVQVRGQVAGRGPEEDEGEPDDECDRRRA